MFNGKRVENAVFFALLVSTNSFADDPKERMEACERVEAARIEEQGKIAPPSVCHLSTRSAEFFLCVESKLKEGNKWSYSTAQCDDIK